VNRSGKTRADAFELATALPVVRFEYPRSLAMGRFHPLTGGRLPAGQLQRPVSGAELGKVSVKCRPSGVIHRPSLIAAEPTFGLEHSTKRRPRCGMHGGLPPWSDWYMQYGLRRAGHLIRKPIVRDIGRQPKRARDGGLPRPGFQDIFSGRCTTCRDRTFVRSCKCLTATGEPSPGTQRTHRQTRPKASALRV
jgi:hypothetical protein